MNIIVYLWKIISVFIDAMRIGDREDALTKESIVFINTGFFFTVVISLFSSMAPSIFLFNIVHLNYYQLIDTKFHLFVVVFALHVICVVAAIILGIYSLMWIFEKMGRKVKIKSVRLLYIISVVGAVIAFTRYMYFGDGIELARLIGVCTSFIWCYGLAKGINVAKNDES